MPNWNPNWKNVQWDREAAHRATAALRRSADELDNTATERERVATRTQAQWRGRHRETFDSYLQDVLRRARVLAAEYREAATRIDRETQRAEAEQRRRVAERERWRREKEEEERRQSLR